MEILYIVLFLFVLSFLISAIVGCARFFVDVAKYSSYKSELDEQLLKSDNELQSLFDYIDDDYKRFNARFDTYNQYHDYDVSFADEHRMQEYFLNDRGASRVARRASWSFKRWR